MEGREECLWGWRQVSVGLISSLFTQDFTRKKKRKGGSPSVDDGSVKNETPKMQEAGVWQQNIVNKF